MKKYFLAVTLILSCILFTSCNETENKEKIILRLAESNSEEHLITKADYEFARLVEEKSNGEIIVEVYPNSELGTDREAAEGVYSGNIDIARVSVSAVSSESYISCLTELPYLFRDSGHMNRALEKQLGPMIDSEIYSHNGKVLTYFDSGAINLYTKNPISSPSELDGLKICPQRVSNLTAGFMPLLGINSIPKNFDEINNAFESGELDGAENDIASYYMSGHYKTAKNLLKTEYKRIPNLLIISNSLYETLSPLQQEALTTAASSANFYQRKNLEAFEKEIEDKLKAEGCTITEPSEELKNEFEESAKSIYNSMADNGYKELITQIKELK